MTLIGTLLTALVVAREWERGTMEALMATPIGAGEFLLGKLIPYFVLGMAAMGLSVAWPSFVFGVPFRGSVSALLLVSAAFLADMLPLGLLISTVTKNQFVASQAALIARVPAGVRAVGLHLRDRQHAAADPAADHGPAGPLLRLQPADAVPGGRCDQRPRARHAGPAGRSAAVLTWWLVRASPGCDWSR